MDLNNALRASISKLNRTLARPDEGGGALVPSLSDCTTSEQLSETNEKLAYVQSSLADLKHQSEELMR